MLPLREINNYSAQNKIDYKIITGYLKYKEVVFLLSDY